MTEINAKEKIYSSKNKAKEILSFKQMYRDLKEASFLGRQLFFRDTKAMFRQSFLGILWAFVPPFFNAAIWIFLKSSGAIKVASPGIPYPIFVMTGTILFQTFTESLNMPYLTIQASKSMLAKLNFPRESFLITSFYKLLFNFGLKFVALLVIAILIKVNFSIYSFLFPIGALWIILFGLSVGVLLIPFQMLFQDFSRIILLSGQVLMYLTPVVYPVPETGFLKYLAKYNPLTEFINIPRNWFNGIHDGNFALYTILIGVSLVIFLIGWILYRITMPIIVERVGS